MSQTPENESKFSTITDEELKVKLAFIERQAEILRIKVLKELDNLETFYKEAQEIQEEIKIRVTK